MLISYCCLIIRPDYVEGHGVDGQIFMFQKIKMTESPDWIRTDPIIQKCFFLLFLSSSMFCGCDHETISVSKNQPNIFLKNITVNHSGTGFNLCFSHAPFNHPHVKVILWLVFPSIACVNTSEMGPPHPSTFHGSTRTRRNGMKRMERMDSEVKLDELVSVRMGILPELSQTFEFRKSWWLMWCFCFQNKSWRSFSGFCIQMSRVIFFLIYRTCLFRSISRCPFALFWLKHLSPKIQLSKHESFFSRS